MKWLIFLSIPLPLSTLSLIFIFFLHCPFLRSSPHPSILCLSSSMSSVSHHPLVLPLSLGPTDLSMKSLSSANISNSSSSATNNSLSGRGGGGGGGASTQLSQPEITAVRQLIAGYRESAAFLLRSADELENLILQQNWFEGKVGEHTHTFVYTHTHTHTLPIMFVLCLSVFLVSTY